MKFLFSFACLAVGVVHVSAHGYLSQPAAYFPNGINTSYTARTNEARDAAFTGHKWNDSPDLNTATFTATFPNTQFKTLRDLIDPSEPTCGNTVTTGSPVDVSSLSSMKWQNDQEQKGFIDSHHGPCEAWIDSSNGAKTRVFQSDCCRRDYTAYPAEIPIDYSSCSGSCTFTFYWLALHEPQWQIYKQCTPIVNGASTESAAAVGTVTPPTTTSTA